MKKHKLPKRTVRFGEIGIPGIQRTTEPSDATYVYVNPDDTQLYNTTISRQRNYENQMRSELNQYGAAYLDGADPNFLGGQQLYDTYTNMVNGYKKMVRNMGYDISNMSMSDIYATANKPATIRSLDDVDAARRASAALSNVATNSPGRMVAVYSPEQLLENSELMGYAGGEVGAYNDTWLPVAIGVAGGGAYGLKNRFKLPARTVSNGGGNVITREQIFSPATGTSYAAYTGGGAPTMSLSIPVTTTTVLPSWVFPATTTATTLGALGYTTHALVTWDWPSDTDTGTADAADTDTGTADAADTDTGTADAADTDAVTADAADTDASANQNLENQDNRNNNNTKKRNTRKPRKEFKPWYADFPKSKLWYNIKQTPGVIRDALFPWGKHSLTYRFTGQPLSNFNSAATNFIIRPVLGYGIRELLSSEVAASPASPTVDSVSVASPASLTVDSVSVTSPVASPNPDSIREWMKQVENLKKNNSGNN